MIHPENAREFLLRAENDLKDRLRSEIAVERPITFERAFLYGAAKRTLAQGHGFRAMQDTHNASVAASLVRLQLDTLLRLYALWWVKDADEFAGAVLGGKQINKCKAADGTLMSDAYLYRKLARIVPWIETVYQESSGFIHFSQRHILATMRADGDDDSGAFVLDLAALDAGRPSNYFNQLAPSFTDVTMRICHALYERFDGLAANPALGTPMGLSYGASTAP